VRPPKARFLRWAIEAEGMFEQPLLQR